MKKRLLCMMVTALACSSGHSQEDDNVWDDTLKSIVSFSGTSTDPYGSSAFGVAIAGMNRTTGAPFSLPKQNVGYLRAGLDFNLTCSGISVSTIYQAKLRDYAQSVEAGIENLPTMLVYQYAYRQPVVADLVDRLEKVMEWGLSAANMNCGTAASIARQDPFGFNSQHAKTACENDEGASSDECLNPPQEHQSEVREDYKEKQKNKFAEMLTRYAALAAAAGTGGAEGSGGTTEGRVFGEVRALDSSCWQSVGDSADLNYTQMVLAYGQLDCSLMNKYGALLPDYIQEGSDSRSELKSKMPTTNVQKLYIESAKVYYAQIDEVVTLMPSAGSALSPENEANVSAARLILSEIAGTSNMPLSSAQVEKLKSKAVADKRAYDYARAILAGSLALAEIDHALTAVEAAINRGIAVQSPEDGFPSHVEKGLSKGLTAARAELDGIYRLNDMSRVSFAEMSGILGM